MVPLHIVCLSRIHHFFHELELQASTVSIFFISKFLNSNTFSSLLQQFIDSNSNSFMFCCYYTKKIITFLFFEPSNNPKLVFTDSEFSLLHTTNRNNFQLSCITNRIGWPEGTKFIVGLYYGHCPSNCIPI